MPVLHVNREPQAQELLRLRKENAEMKEEIADLKSWRMGLKQERSHLRNRMRRYFAYVEKAIEPTLKTKKLQQYNAVAEPVKKLLRQEW